MKFIKIKSIEILTNGSLHLTKTGFMTPGQIFFYKKDYKSLEFVQKQKNISKLEATNTFYKPRYTF